jgi:hypothetical protein
VSYKRGSLVRTQLRPPAKTWSRRVGERPLTTKIDHNGGCRPTLEAVKHHLKPPCQASSGDSTRPCWRICPSTCLTDALENMCGSSVAELLGPDAAARLGGGPPDGAHVVAAQVDSDGVLGDVHGDHAPGVDAAQGDLLPGDHDDAGVAGPPLGGDRLL